MKFNGVDPRTLHPGISIAKEIPPGTVTSQLETLGGSTGEIIVGRTIKQGEYTVRVNIAGKYRAQGWEIRKLLAAWACAADTVTHQLVPTHWPDVYYEAILKEISPPEFTFGFATIDVVFAIPRPIAISATYKQTLAEEGVSSQEIEVEGSSYARPTVYATPVSGVNRVFFYVDGKPYASLNGSFAEGNMIRLDTDPPRVRLYTPGEGYVDKPEMIEYDSTDLQAMAEAFTPGTHTVMVFPSIDVSVMWRDEWL